MTASEGRFKLRVNAWLREGYRLVLLKDYPSGYIAVLEKGNRQKLVREHD